MENSILNSSIGEITYHLENQEFDGPLDLLLSMVKETKIDIRDIFITDITNQFVAYVHSLQEMNYEYIAEYIALAATLLEIKSSRFLPKLEFSDGDNVELISPEENLYLRMEAYKLFKETAEKLSPLETLNRFYRIPKFTEDDYRMVVKNFSLDRLIDCFKNILERVEHFEKDVEAKTIVKERFSVSDRVLEIARLIRQYREIKFFDLFNSDYTRLEIINTFLAILEILKKQIAYAEQETDFSDIIIKHNDKEDTVAQGNEEELTKDVEKYN